MSTTTPRTRKPASSTAKSGKATRASRKRSAAAAAKAKKPAPGKPTTKTAPRTVTVAPRATAAGASATPAAKTPDPVVVSEVTPMVTGSDLRKKALINAVAEQSGVKRRDAKAALEAALTLLGEAIAEGRQINLPGFGKLKVTRTKQLANGQVFMARIRQPIASDGGDGAAGDKNAEKPTAEGAKDPLAEAAE